MKTINLLAAVVLLSLPVHAMNSFEIENAQINKITCVVLDPTSTLKVLSFRTPSDEADFTKNFPAQVKADHEPADDSFHDYKISQFYLDSAQLLARLTMKYEHENHSLKLVTRYESTYRGKYHLNGTVQIGTRNPMAIGCTAAKE